MLVTLAAGKLVRRHLPLFFRLFHLQNRGLGSSKSKRISIRYHINTSSSSPKPLSVSEHKAMVALLVATTSDPASINPANALLGMPGWKPGPHFQVQTIKIIPFLLAICLFELNVICWHLLG